MLSGFHPAGSILIILVLWLKLSIKHLCVIFLKLPLWGSGVSVVTVLSVLLSLAGYTYDCILFWAWQNVNGYFLSEKWVAGSCLIYSLVYSMCEVFSPHTWAFAPKINMTLPTWLALFIYLFLQSFFILLLVLIAQCSDASLLATCQSKSVGRIMSFSFDFLLLKFVVS